MLTWDACTVVMLSTGVVTEGGVNARLLEMALPLPGRSS